MECGQHDFHRGLADLRDGINRDAGPVICDGHAAILMQDDLDMCGPPGEGLVDRVVDDLIQQVVQPVGTGAADVHGRALADAVDALKDLNLLSSVRLIRRGVCVFGHRTSGVPSIN